MRSKINAAAVAFAFALPIAMANAQTPPSADPHHPPGQGAGTPPAAGQPAVPAPSTSTGPAAPQPGAPMGMMMGDMRQMMQMMQQMMQMMGGGGMGAGQGGMMGGNMPMMQAMPGGPGMAMAGPSAMRGPQGQAGEPMMFRHTDGVLAFTKAELRITEAQTPQWNAFADAARTGAKAMREAMQRVSAQATALTAPEQIDRRLGLLTTHVDAAKAVSVAAKALYAVLTQDQRKLADDFMAQHMLAMRAMMP